MEAKCFARLENCYRRQFLILAAEREVGEVVVAALAYAAALAQTLILVEGCVVVLRNHSNVFAPLSSLTENSAPHFCKSKA